MAGAADLVESRLGAKALQRRFNRRREADPAGRTADKFDQVMPGQDTPGGFQGAPQKSSTTSPNQEYPVLSPSTEIRSSGAW